MMDAQKENRNPPGEVTEKTYLKWKMIQLAAILPLLLSVVFLLRFHGSILGMIVFFLILIVGIILPQLYQDIIRSHLLLKKEVDKLKQQLSAPPSNE
jgi:hypothetical protein